MNETRLLEYPADVIERMIRRIALLNSQNQEMLQTLKDIRMSNQGSIERQRGWDNALIIIENMEGK